jgi:hypothetical protein
LNGVLLRIFGGRFMGTFTEYRFTASGGLPSTSFFGISMRIDIRDMNGMKDQLAGRMLKTS